MTDPPSQYQLLKSAVKVVANVKKKNIMLFYSRMKNCSNQRMVQLTKY